jgi:nicotinamidase-related amidase
MQQRVWDAFLTQRDRQVFDAAGYGVRAGFGKRPALLIIDVSYGFCGDRPEPILTSIKRWSNSCGEEAWQAIGVIARLAGVARERGLPVIYTTAAYREDRWDIGMGNVKNGRAVEWGGREDVGEDPNAFVREVAPAPQDIVVVKAKPSAFFGTALASHLTLLGADSLIVTGTTTSGCVRASVVDAFSHNYRVAVVEDGCFDRSQASHALSLCDMDAKYADVVQGDEVLRHFGTLPHGLFALPGGKAGAAP